MELTPIKVTILLKPRDPKSGRFLYPDFNKIAPALRDNLPWPEFFDRYGGWMYDRTNDHTTDTPDSPAGQWHGVVLVPDPFADAAAAMFPETVKQLTEAELEAFYDERATVDQPDFEIHEPTVKAVLAMQAAGVAIPQAMKDAMDPTKDSIGVRVNHRKKWASLKQRRNVTIKRKNKK